MNYGILSLVPIIITLLIVFSIKNIFVALWSGILSAVILIGIFTGDFFIGIKSMTDIFTNHAAMMTTAFVLLTGSIMCVTNRSGGVKGLVRYCTQKHQIIKSSVGTQLLAFILGIIMFVDATSSIAVTAIAGKPFLKNMPC